MDDLAEATCCASAAELRTRLTLLSLPVEVKHKIYSHLFCKGPAPIWLVAHYKLSRPLYSLSTSPRHPIFETQLFRCCQKAYEDAVTFAYGSNSFELRGDLTAFYRLAPLALSSIRKLSFVMGPAKSVEQEVKALGFLKQHCHGLEKFELVLQQDVLLASAAFLTVSRSHRGQNLPKKSLALDLYVWDRHFSFDPIYRDFAWARDIIDDGLKRAGLCPMGRNIIENLPYQSDIVLTADVTAGAVEALDAHLAFQKTDVLIKNSNPPARDAYRAKVGRSTRLWYDLV